MDLILELISKYGVIAINVFGVVVSICIFMNYGSLKSQRDKIEDALDGKRTRKKLNRKTHELEEEEVEERASSDVMRKREREFNKVCSRYQIVSQLVPLFPLFGILGTVAGLIQQLGAQDLETIIGSLDMALGTTLYGLIWAILLKILVAFLPARVIYEAETMLEGFDKEFSDSIALNNISD